MARAKFSEGGKRISSPIHNFAKLISTFLALKLESHGVTDFPPHSLTAAVTSPVNHSKYVTG